MPENMILLRDANGEPVMQLIEHDRLGKFRLPYYGYVWVPGGQAREDAQELARQARQDKRAAQARADADALAQWETDGGA